MTETAVTLPTTDSSHSASSCSKQHENRYPFISYVFQETALLPSSPPEVDGRLGDKCESSHSFDVSVKNRPSHCITALYSRRGPLKCRAPLQRVICLEICVVTIPGEIADSQKKSLANIFPSQLPMYWFQPGRSWVLAAI